MEKNEQLVKFLERTIEDIRKLQASQARQEDFESYVRTKLEQISNDIETIKKSIVG